MNHIQKIKLTSWSGNGYAILILQILEFKNEESGKHVENVGMISRVLAQKVREKYKNKYKIAKKDVEYISMAAALHDIGKIYIPDNILNKPGKLDASERAIMETHTALGAAAVERLEDYRDRPIFKFTKEICLGHHERWDGNGYPNRLKENNIPIAAQIVSLADCYDALISDRVYRKGLSHEDATAMIFSNKCGVFNPDLLECFKESEEAILARLSSGTTVDITKEGLSNIIKEICRVK